MMIFVLIAIINRGDSVIQTIDCILNNHYPDFEIIVVDQSTNDNCKKAIDKYERKLPIFYHHTDTVGMARARNLGIGKPDSEIIAITDDDCTVPENWLFEINQLFTEYPAVSIVFGNVVPAKYDDSSGFIPSYIREATRIVSRVTDKNDIDGLGACMAMRKRPGLNATVSTLCWELVGGSIHLLRAIWSSMLCIRGIRFVRPLSCLQFIAASGPGQRAHGLSTVIGMVRYGSNV